MDKDSFAESCDIFFNPRTFPHRKLLLRGPDDTHQCILTQLTCLLDISSAFCRIIEKKILFTGLTCILWISAKLPHRSLYISEIFSILAMHTLSIFSGPYTVTEENIIKIYITIQLIFVFCLLLPFFFVPTFL